MNVIYTDPEIIRNIISLWTVVGVCVLLGTHRSKIKSYWGQVAWMIGVGPLCWTALIVGAITPGCNIKFKWTPLIMLVLTIVVLVAIHGK